MSLTPPRPEVLRAKTALRRSDLSRPIRLALENGLITESTCVFDYGCGQGDDLKRLRRRGITCAGWDPAHRPAGPLVPADVVNLGYVVNVVENPLERAQVLRKAWDLSRSVLIVSAQLVHDAKRENTAFADGVLTRAQTFQKYFDQQELREWIDTTLTGSCVAAAPGIFYVFREEAVREEFVASRYRARRAITRLRHSDRLFEQHRELLNSLVSFLEERGRLPTEDELATYGAIVDALGSMRKAGLVLRRVMGEDAWSTAQQERSEDLLVYLALSQFGKRLRFSALSNSLQMDVRAF